MSPWCVAEEFRLVAEADPEIAAAGLACVNEQTGGTGSTVTFPRLVFSARLKALARSSQVGTADVSLSVESHAQDATVDATAGKLHDDLVALVSRFFFGDRDATAADVKADIAARISARGIVEVDPRYVLITSDPALEAHRFKTPFTLKCGVFFSA